jgi:hypothetical protein
LSRQPDGEKKDSGLSETVGVVLMAILVIAVAAIIASIVFGVIVLYPKSAYIVVQTEVKNVTPGNWYLSVFHANGDNAYLNNTSLKEGMPVDFQFTTPGGALLIPRPEPANSPMTWNPGDTLFVYNRSGILAVTKDESLARSGTGLPMGVWRFDVVDRTDNVLIYSQNTGVGVATPTQTLTPTPTNTGTPNTTVVTTATTVIPTTNATVSPTTVVTTSPTPDCGTISGTGPANWVINIYTRHPQSGTWVLAGTTSTDPSGHYSFSGLVFQPNQDYELREAAPLTGVIDRSLNNGHCYQTNVNF